MNITNTVKKNLTLHNQIMVDDVLVKGQSATINSETGEINITDWINNMEVYKSNRIAIRQKEADFEDLAFEEQEKLKTEVIE